MALTLSHYRFGLDELAENTHGWHAAEDVNPASGAIGLDVNFCLRFTVQADATGLVNVDNEFQFRRNGGTWTNITTASIVVRAVAVAPLTNGSNCTKRLGGTGTFEASAAGQTEDGTSGGSSNDIVAGGNSETECGLILRSVDITGGDKIEFRLTRDGGTLLDTYAVTPTLLIPQNGTLSATLDAVTSSAAGAVDVVGTASPTLGALTLSATGTVDVVGTSTPTLEALTLSATGTVGSAEIIGTLSVTLNALTSSATGAVDVVGTSNPTLEALTSSATGSIDVVGTVAPTLGALTSSATSTVDIVGTSTPTLEALTLSATGTVGSIEIIGILNTTLDTITSNALGVVASPILDEGRSTIQRNPDGTINYERSRLFYFPRPRPPALVWFPRSI